MTRKFDLDCWIRWLKRRYAKSSCRRPRVIVGTDLAGSPIYSAKNKGNFPTIQ